MGEFSFPRLIAAVKRWPLAIASWINDPRLDRLRHLANTHVHMNVRLCWQSNQAIVDRPSLATVGWRCRNGGPVRSVYISWLNSPTIKRERPYGRERPVGRTF